MSNIDKMKSNSHLSSLNDELFTELTFEEASRIEGSGKFISTINFDYRLRSRPFYVPRGGTIKLLSLTKSAETNPDFYATIENLSSRMGGKKTSRKLVTVGRDVTTWRRVNGGQYRIIFTDDKDGVFVKGKVTIGYTS